MVRVIAAVLSAAFLAETAHANSSHKKVKAQYYKKHSAKPSHHKPSHGDKYKPSPDKHDYENPYHKNPRAPIGDLNTFFFFADWGHADNTVYQQLIAQAMAVTAQFLPKGRPDFIIADGDNFYNNGVRNTSDSRWEIAWNQVYSYPSQEVPFYATFGNHDYYYPLPGPTLEGNYNASRTGSPEVEIQFYKENALAHHVNEAKPLKGKDRWIFPERHYTRTYMLGKSGKTAEFFYFDTILISAEAGGITGGLNNPSSANYTGTAEIDWLENALRTSKADWKIPVGHYPLFSPSVDHGDNPDLILPLEPMFRGMMYLNGHDHSMSAVEYNGIKYYTNGAGGKSLYAERFPYTPFYADANLLFSSQTYGFFQFTFSPDAEKLKLIVHKAGNSSKPLSTYFPGQPAAVAWQDIIYLKGDKNEPSHDDGSAHTASTENFHYKINSENPVPFTDPHEHEPVEMEPALEEQQVVVDHAPEEEQQEEDESIDKRGRRARVMGRLKNAQA